MNNNDLSNQVAEANAILVQVRREQQAQVLVERREPISVAHPVSEASSVSNHSSSCSQTSESGSSTGSTSCDENGSGLDGTGNEHGDRNDASRKGVDGTDTTLESHLSKNGKCINRSSDASVSEDQAEGLLTSKLAAQGQENRTKSSNNLKRSHENSSSRPHKKRHRRHQEPIEAQDQDTHSVSHKCLAAQLPCNSNRSASSSEEEGSPSDLEHAAAKGIAVSRQRINEKHSHIKYRKAGNDWNRSSPSSMEDSYTSSMKPKAQQHGTKSKTLLYSLPSYTDTKDSKQVHKSKLKASLSSGDGKKKRASRMNQDTLAGDTKKSAKPKRPMSSYNFFFRDERAAIVAAHEEAIGQGQKPRKVSFEEMGRLIAERWKNIDAKSLSKYDNLAQQDSQRYCAEMEKYYELESARRRAHYFPGLTGVGLEQLNIDIALATTGELPASTRNKSRKQSPPVSGTNEADQPPLTVSSSLSNSRTQHNINQTLTNKIDNPGQDQNQNQQTQMLQHFVNGLLGQQHQQKQQIQQQQEQIQSTDLNKMVQDALATLLGHKANEMKNSTDPHLSSLLLAQICAARVGQQTISNQNSTLCTLLEQLQQQQFQTQQNSQQKFPRIQQHLLGMADSSLLTRPLPIPQVDKTSLNQQTPPLAPTVPCNSFRPGMMERPQWTQQTARNDSVPSNGEMSNMIGKPSVALDANQQAQQQTQQAQGVSAPMYASPQMTLDPYSMQILLQMACNGNSLQQHQQQGLAQIIAQAGMSNNKPQQLMQQQPPQQQQMYLPFMFSPQVSNLLQSHPQQHMPQGYQLSVQTPQMIQGNAFSQAVAHANPGASNQNSHSMQGSSDWTSLVSSIVPILQQQQQQQNNTGR